MTIGLMEVTLVGAKGLKRTDFLGNIDPYVVINYKNQEYSSKTAKGTSPLWNERFIFTVDHPSSELDDDQHQQYKLFLTIMDRDTFTQDDFLGQTNIYLKELFEEGIEDGRVELGTQKYRIVSSDKKYQGEIQLGITFIRKGWENHNHHEKYGRLKPGSDY